MRAFRPFAAALCGILLAACASHGGVARSGAATAAPAGTSPPVPAAATTPPFESRIVRDGRVLMAPQPQAADLVALRGQGVRRVINLRAAEEMATLGFDEAALAAAEGMDYTLLPIANNAAFSPAVLDAFAKAMAEADGQVLLHCASGARAGQLYAAWLVREQGLSPDEAMRRVAPLGLWPTPMERLLDRPLRLEFAGKPAG